MPFGPVCCDFWKVYLSVCQSFNPFYEQRIHCCVTVTFCDLSKPLPLNGLCNILGASATGAHLLEPGGELLPPLWIQRQPVGARKAKGEIIPTDIEDLRPRKVKVSGRCPQSLSTKERVRERQFMQVRRNSRIIETKTSTGAWLFSGHNLTRWTAFCQSSLDECMEIWISQSAHHVFEWCHNKSHSHWKKKNTN